MCIIIDANMMGQFLDPQNEHMKPIHKWLEKGGKVVYSDYGKLGAEILHKFKRWLKNNERLGRTKKADAKEVKQAIRNLPLCRSNDPHILGLAEAMGVSVLCTNDDRLEQDFKNIIGGKIYKTKKHRHLLTKDTCP